MGRMLSPVCFRMSYFPNLQQVPVGRDAAHGRRQLVVRQRVQRQVDAAAVGLHRGSQPCQRDLYRRCSAAWPSACRPPASPAPGRRRGRWSVGKLYHEEKRLVCCRFAPLTILNRCPCSAVQHTVANSLVFASCPAQDFVTCHRISKHHSPGRLGRPYVKVRSSRHCIV